jgi:hypothetical protein
MESNVTDLNDIPSYHEAMKLGICVGTTINIQRNTNCCAQQFCKVAGPLDNDAICCKSCGFYGHPGDSCFKHFQLTNTKTGDEHYFACSDCVDKYELLNGGHQKRKLLKMIAEAERNPTELLAPEVFKERLTAVYRDNERETDSEYDEEKELYGEEEYKVEDDEDEYEEDEMSLSYESSDDQNYLPSDDDAGRPQTLSRRRGKRRANSQPTTKRNTRASLAALKKQAPIKKKRGTTTRKPTTKRNTRASSAALKKQAPIKKKRAATRKRKNMDEESHPHQPPNKQRKQKESSSKPHVHGSSAPRVTNTLNRENRLAVTRWINRAGNVIQGWFKPFMPEWPKFRVYLVTINELTPNKGYTEKREDDKRREKPKITVLSLSGNDDDMHVFADAFLYNEADYEFEITAEKKDLIDHLNGYN